MLNDKRLDSWLKAGLNVLLVGPHGIGKTERVLQALKRNSMKYLYFSASTMDPFTDFVGIPRVVETDGVKHIEFIKPKQVAAGDFEYLVVDEYNRAHKKVRNAMMECVQFKSINGVHFPNLKGVIAMINPPDDEDTYDVEKLDPAQEDRFQIKVIMPNGPSKDYFKQKHGELGEIAVNWWQQIDPKHRNKGLVSPRRLEYAIDLYRQNIDIEDVLPKEVNIKQLKTELGKAGLSSLLPELKKLSAQDLQKKLTGNGNLRDLVLTKIVDGEFPIESVDAFGDEEIINASASPKVLKFIVSKVEAEDKRYTELGHTIANYANSSKKELQAAASAVAKAILTAEQNKLKKVSAEERKAGMSLEDVKRRIGELAKPTADETSARAILSENAKHISADAGLKTMLLRIAEIRKSANIEKVCQELGITLK
jgi:hypothetical protein